MADAWDLGWKLAGVLRSAARPELLHPYSEERQAAAQELIDFDREFARTFSAPPKESAEADGEGVDPEEFQRYFVQQGRFTAGAATRCAPSMITGEPTHHHLAAGLPVGMRFHPAPMVRLAAANPIHPRARGAGRRSLAGLRLRRPRRPREHRLPARRLCEFLTSEKSPIPRFTPADADPDAVIDLRALFQQGHLDLAVETFPAVLRPRKGPFRLIDQE